MTKPTKWRVSNEDSDQPGHPPSLIGVFGVRFMQQRLRYADSKDSDQIMRMLHDLSLRWLHIILLVSSCYGLNVLH